MAEDNGHRSLLGMGEEIFSFVMECASADGGRKHQTWFRWEKWIRVPLEFMVEDGDTWAKHVLKTKMRLSKSKRAVLGIAEELLELILRRAAEEVRIEWLQVPLEMAVETGNLDMTLRLVDTSELSRYLCGARKWYDLKSTFLHTAVIACNDDPAIVNALLSTGAKTDLDTYGYYYLLGSPLHFAANFGFAVVAQALISAGATVDLLNHDFRSPLFYAISGEHTEATRVLLSSGANPNVKDIDDSCLFAFSSPGCLQALVEAGMDIFKVDEHGFSGFHRAVFSSCRSDVFETLYRAGADLNARDKIGRTPLWYTCLTSFGSSTIDITCVQELLRLGANDMICDLDGQSPADRIRSDLAEIADHRRRHKFDYESKGHDRQIREEVLAILTRHRAWRRRGWLLVLRQRADRGGAVGAAGWVVQCPEEGVFRSIVESLA